MLVNVLTVDGHHFAHCLIGKGGSKIRELQETTGAYIKVLFFKILLYIDFELNTWVSCVEII